MTVAVRRSGFLNNCALHCGSEKIIDAIRYFAGREKGDATLPAYENYRENYEKFKRILANYYHLDQTISWSSLHHLLTDSLKQNPAAQQIIIGLAGREFIRDTIPADQPVLKADLCDIQDNGEYSGRFKSLHIQEASAYFYKPLGLEVVDLSSSVPEIHPLADPIARLEIYGNGDSHFELVPNASNTVLLDNKEGNINSIQPLFEIAHELISSNESPRDVALGIEDVKTVVHKLQHLNTQREELLGHLNSWWSENRNDLWASNNAFFNTVSSKTLPEARQALNNASAEEDESDEEFAARLQAAEFILAGK